MFILFFSINPLYVDFFSCFIHLSSLLLLQPCCFLLSSLCDLCVSSSFIHIYSFSFIILLSVFLCCLVLVLYALEWWVFAGFAAFIWWRHVTEITAEEAAIEAAEKASQEDDVASAP